MKKLVDIISELSSALTSFGRCEGSVAIIERAIAANSWFTEQDICRSIEAIRLQMLDINRFEQWISHYPTPAHATPKRIAIIMAGNIPLVGFFDLLCTLASGNQAWIKPSSKDQILMQYICGLIKSIEPAIPIYIYDDSLSYDAVIATGGEDANRYFNERFAQTRRLCRSSRHSIAVLTEESTKEQMTLLAEDIYSYSGLGCRNVAIIFLPKGHSLELPQYPTSSKYRNNYLHTKALLTLRGVPYEDNGTSVLIRTKELPTSLSSISLYEYDSLEQVNEWIAQHDDELQCIVSSSISHPRRVDFGEAQHPTLMDYADGVDTMKFLEFNYQ